MFLVSSGTAETAESWKCNVTVGNINAFRSKVELIGQTLKLYQDDYSGKATDYRVVSVTENSISATRKMPSGQSNVFLNRISGKFTETLRTKSGYTERYEGHCARK
jgi:hypothetical protein